MGRRFREKDILPNVTSQYETYRDDVTGDAEHPIFRFEEVHQRSREVLDGETAGEGRVVGGVGGASGQGRRGGAPERG